MKYIKTFETKESDEEKVDLLRDLLSENPLSKDHDFYVFIAAEDFKETKKGLYKKILNIENMVRIVPDMNSVAAMSMLQMRAQFQGNCKVYHIWLPVELRDEVEGKGGRSLDSWIVELINKYKRIGSDEEGKRITKDVIDRRKDIGNYNL